MSQVCNFFVGEMITCMEKVSLNGQTEVIIYGTSMGSIGILFPFETKEVLLYMLLAQSSNHH